jgi:hypothetical protein
VKVAGWGKVKEGARVPDTCLTRVRHVSDTNRSEAQGRGRFREFPSDLRHVGARHVSGTNFRTNFRGGTSTTRVDTPFALAVLTKRLV